jgi:hypothetical protein
VHRWRTELQPQKRSKVCGLVANKQLQRTEKRPVLRFIVVALIFLVAGAEIGIALQLVGFIDLLGVELFLTFFFGGFLWRFKVAAHVIKTALERLDPFFFIPTRSQVISCPTLLVHAVPGLVSLCLLGYVATEISDGYLR